MRGQRKKDSEARRTVTFVVGRANSTKHDQEWHCVDPEGLSVGLAYMRGLLMEGSTRPSGWGRVGVEDRRREEGM